MKYLRFLLWYIGIGPDVCPWHNVPLFQRYTSDMPWDCPVEGCEHFHSKRTEVRA